MPSWDPDLYDRFKAYRDRPALDLLLQVPADLDPHEIWDLGCGTGEHAAVLAARHPTACVYGLDSSPEMLKRARARKSPVDWVQADIAGFAPPSPPDLIFTNAALQWVPDHRQLFPRLVSQLADGGVFACQMPATDSGAWRGLLREVAADGPWARRLRDVDQVGLVAAPERYYDWLAPLCAEVDIWSTVYLHVLEGDDPIVAWTRGSSLRPYLDALTYEAEQAAFLAVCRHRLAELFPRRKDGTTLFPFPRLFMVARR
jgi:trans-aconitate 2-methyltransferase